jgi:hypothetical protein
MYFPSQQLVFREKLLFPFLLLKKNVISQKIFIWMTHIFIDGNTFVRLYHIEKKRGKNTSRVNHSKKRKGVYEYETKNS